MEIVAINKYVTNASQFVAYLLILQGSGGVAPRNSRIAILWKMEMQLSPFLLCNFLHFGVAKHTLILVSALINDIKNINFFSIFVDHEVNKMMP